VGNLILLVIVLAVFFVLFTSQRRRQKAAAAIQQELVPGARVMTTAGMLATVAYLDDDEVILEIAPGITSRYVRGAIARVIPDEDSTDHESFGEHESLDDEETDGDESDSDTEGHPGEIDGHPRGGPTRDAGNDDSPS
jgi:preprotein translocase subunit YajC